MFVLNMSDRYSTHIRKKYKNTLSTSTTIDLRRMLKESTQAQSMFTKHDDVRM